MSTTKVVTAVVAATVAAACIVVILSPPASQQPTSTITALDDTIDWGPQGCTIQARGFTGDNTDLNGDYVYSGWDADGGGHNTFRWVSFFSLRPR